MTLKEELGQIGENTKKDLRRYFQVIKQHPLIFLIYIIVFIIVLLSLTILPHWQISQFGINNTTDQANYENQFRATLVQILGGIAVLIGIYFAWGNLKVSQSTLESNQKHAEINLKMSLASLKSDQETAKKNMEIALSTLDSNIKNAQKSLEIAQQGQITERFTRAVDQLGNDKLEIRLGGIYALESISKESVENYWPIMEILTAYVRNNSRVEVGGNKKFTPASMEIQAMEITKKQVLEVRKISEDINAILFVIKRREHSYGHGESNRLDLHRSYLREINLTGHINLNEANLEEADLKEAVLERIHLVKANLVGINLEGADLVGAKLMDADLERANLVKAHLNGANLEGAYLERANLKGADLKRAKLIIARLGGANLEGANLKGADLEGAVLEKIHFKNDANIFEIILEGTVTDLGEREVEGALLGGANLEGANLKRADFTEADLNGANLKEADLKGADLNGANLKEADLKGADLEGANLIGARYLTTDQLSTVKTLYNAELDEDLRQKLEQKYPDKFKELIKKPEGR